MPLRIYVCTVHNIFLPKIATQKRRKGYICSGEIYEQNPEPGAQGHHHQGRSHLITRHCKWCDRNNTSRLGSSPPRTSNPSHHEKHSKQTSTAGPSTKRLARNPRNYQGHHKQWKSGPSLVVQWLRFLAPNARGPGSSPGQWTGSHALQLRPGTAK